jgi:hypothetical protein
MALTKDSDYMDRIDYVHNNDPKCPHCDTIIDISAGELYELYEEGEHDIRCSCCEKKIVVITHVKFSFSTDEQPDFDFA